MNNAATSKGQADLRTLLSAFLAQALRYDTDTLLRFLKRAELTLPLLSVLNLVERESMTSIGELAVRLDYSLANASLLVDKLVCQGYVTRVENASDRRHKQVQLTSAGQALLAELRAARADNVAQELLRLPPDLVTRTIELFRAITDELPLPEAPAITEIVSVIPE